MGGWGLGVGVSDLGAAGWGSVVGVWGLVVEVRGSEVGCWGLGVGGWGSGVEGSWFRGRGLGFRVRGTWLGSGLSAVVAGAVRRHWSRYPTAPVEILDREKHPRHPFAARDPDHGTVEVLAQPHCPEPNGSGQVHLSTITHSGSPRSGDAMATHSPHPMLPAGALGAVSMVGAVSAQGYLAHTKTPTPLGPPQDPRHRPTVGS